LAAISYIDIITLIHLLPTFDMVKDRVAPLLIISVIIFGVFLLAVLLPGSTKDKTDGSEALGAQPKTLRIGYCPTMRIYAEKIDTADNTVVIEYETSYSALQALRSGVIDAVVIGRKAYPEELSAGINYVQVDTEAVTLVSDQYQTIPVTKLQELVIHAAVDPVPELLAELNLIQYQDVKEALEKGLSDAVLIRWVDIDYSSADLVVPEYPDGSKLDLFRTPFIYYKKDLSEDLLLKYIELTG
jgi:hypothetical protein